MFRQHAIDGATFAKIEENYLINTLQMKLGPILKLKLAMAEYLGGPCPACCRCNQQKESDATIFDT